jgi:hypothetical protein
MGVMLVPSYKCECCIDLAGLEKREKKLTSICRSGSLSVIKAEQVNILEDNLQDLDITDPAPETEASTSRLDFRAFEVKTVRLTLA